MCVTGYFCLRVSGNTKCWTVCGVVSTPTSYQLYLHYLLHLLFLLNYLLFIFLIITEAHKDPPLAWKKNCLIQTTFWSPCSKSCGLGISVRVNNNNHKCEMRKDMRLCLLRPCKKSVINSIQVVIKHSLKLSDQYCPCF